MTRKKDETTPSPEAAVPAPEISEVDEERKSPLTISIVSLFPKSFESWLQQGVVSRAIEKGIVSLPLIDLRQFGEGRHQVTDDYPFGGGAGMVLKPEPVFAAVESLRMDLSNTPVILLSPRGRIFSHAIARELSQREAIVLIAGHYEGVDERVRKHLANDEISIGDYVLSCGELAAMVVSDAIVRMVPGALSPDSTVEESFTDHLLEYPQYTRPAEFRGWSVPEVLLSGHHGEVARWRRECALRDTLQHRPDLLPDADLTEEERALVASWQQSASQSRK